MAGVTTLSKLFFVRPAPAVAWLLLLAAVATLVRGETATDDPNAVLRRFLGAWQTEAHLHKAGRPASDVVTRGNANCEQTLGNRYFEFRTATVPAGESDLQIMTYDPASRLYRQWVFSSDGYSHAAEGRWTPRPPRSSGAASPAKPILSFLTIGFPRIDSSGPCGAPRPMAHWCKRSPAPCRVPAVIRQP